VVEAAVSAIALRPRLLAVWGVLLVLVGVIVALELSDRDGGAESGTAPGGRDPKLLLPVSVQELGAVEIVHAGTVHRFERDDAGVWFYHGAHTQAQAAHGHQADPAMGEKIAYALAGFDRARIERTFPLEDGGKIYGVATPQIVVLVYRPKALQPVAQYAVGDIAPDKLSRYVLMVGRPPVVTIAEYQISNLLNLVAMASGAAPHAATVPDRR
jgi:hypothetical protein